MPKRSVQTILLALAALLAVLAVWLLVTSPSAVTQREAERRRAEAGSEGASAPTSLASITVDSHLVKRSSERARIDVSGLLEPIQKVVLAAEVAGQVVAVEVQEHAAVDDGDVLVRLDPALPDAAVKRAQAAVLRAEAQDRLAQSELGRQRNLSKRGVTSSADLDRAESEARSGRARVAEAEAELVDAKIRLAKTEIRAPFAGFVTELDLDPGTYLQPGQRVAEVADLSQIEVGVGVSAREILALTVGDPVELRVQALPGERFKGEIASLSRTADSKTRKYRVPVRFANAELRLLPGMLGTLRFKLGGSRSAVIVPRRAVREEFDLDYLYVLDPAEEGRAVARRRRVATQPLAFRPEIIEVTSGLEPGEVIATTGVRELRDGQLVRVREDVANGTSVQNGL